MSVDFEKIGKAARNAFLDNASLVGLGEAAVAAYLAQGVCTVTVDGMAYCESRCIFACSGCGTCSRSWAKNGISGPSCPAANLNPHTERQDRADKCETCGNRTSKPGCEAWCPPGTGSCLNYFKGPDHA